MVDALGRPATGGPAGPGPVERLGVLGGTFDPIHVGHVVVGAEVRAALALDTVLYVVAGDPWQKRGSVVASAADRVAVVRAAIGGIEGLDVCTVEVERTGPSVTADTLEALGRADRRLFLLLGADAVANMATWRRLDDTRHLATVVVMDRAGEAAASPPGPGWDVTRVAVPRIDVSSSDIRERLRTGRPVAGLVPPAALAEITARRLYTDVR